MGLMTFKGGVHPYDGKEFSKAKPVRKLLPKGELVFPLSQHIGAPASPIVNVGDYVLRGQKIAEAGGFVSSPIFSSVSGTVKAIEPRRVAVGDMVNSIVGKRRYFFRVYVSPLPRGALFSPAARRFLWKRKSRSNLRHGSRCL